jgi:hypothetical protein
VTCWCDECGAADPVAFRKLSRVDVHQLCAVCWQQQRAKRITAGEHPRGRIELVDGRVLVDRRGVLVAIGEAS